MAKLLIQLVERRLFGAQVSNSGGQDYYEERYRERALRALRALPQRAAKLGMQMVPIAQPA